MAEPKPEVDIVEATWQELLTSDRVDRELVRAAYAEPRLRQLFPWVGMWELHFSRCTDHPPTWDIPYIAPRNDGGFFVEGPVGTGYHRHGPVVRTWRESGDLRHKER
ncbi:DUF6193 family natural product biosynthesis protein [Streptomyces sp. NPDC054933]